MRAVIEWLRYHTGVLHAFEAGEDMSVCGHASRSRTEGEVREPLLKPGTCIHCVSIVRARGVPVEVQTVAERDRQQRKARARHYLRTFGTWVRRRHRLAAYLPGTLALVTPSMDVLFDALERWVWTGRSARAVEQARQQAASRWAEAHRQVLSGALSKTGRPVVESGSFNRQQSSR